MSRNKRIILAVVGLALVALSVAALIYAFAPAGTLREASPIIPTLLTLPPGGVP